MVRRGDRPGFRSALSRLLEASPSASAGRAAEAAAFARANFDPARQSSAYLALFQSLLRGGNR